MSTLLATAVAAGFLWSIMLFFAAVFIRERRQDAGFGWALGGAVLFFVVFADRLPGTPMWLRDPVTLLPWVSDGAELFASSLLALAILFAVYLFRVAVFYQLFLKKEDIDSDDSDEDVLNDDVAPALSYLCFAICLICLLQPAYQLGVFGTVLLIGALVAIHFWRILTMFVPYLENILAFVVIWTVKVRVGISRFLVHAITKIAWVEELRRDGSWATPVWAEERLRELDAFEAEAEARRKEKLAEAARSSGNRRKRRKGQK